MSILESGLKSAVLHGATSLLRGGLVAFPTETVYGLGADANNEVAVARVYAVKGRPTGHPLIVHISSFDLLPSWASQIPGYAKKLADKFWPGPMTLILPRTKLAKDFITGGQENVGVRIPSHNVALELLKEFESQGGLGVAAPSANRFGAVSPTTAHAVRTELEDFLTKDDQILDGGPCEVGVESTIIDCTGNVPRILRPGGITQEMIENLLEISIGAQKLQRKGSENIKASGLLESHYAPKAKIHLSGSASAGDGFLALESFATPTGAIRVAAPKSNEEYAKILYEAFRRADMLGLSKLFAIPATDGGIAAAINDRLSRAAFEK